MATYNDVDVNVISTEQLECLKEQGFTTGLAQALIGATEQFPLRIWVLDNSGSTIQNDGHRIVETTNRHDVRLVRCTRWNEIRESVRYHVQLAALLRAPTRFRLLNNPGASISQHFAVAEMGEATIGKDVDRAIEIMQRSQPYGVTPLTEHVTDIYTQVSEMAPQLRKEGRKVAVIIATDGLPSDDQGHGGRFVSDQFVQALRLLDTLPVWVVIRLCTDDEEVVKFYEDLDTNLELSLEVLDDFVGEAREVHRKNPWLNYALPFHRCREFGFHHRIFDLLDERTLTKEELFDFCALLFGALWDGVPDPAVDWIGFKHHLGELLRSEECQWNPVSKKVVPWINLRELDRTFGHGSSTGVIMWLVAVIIIGVLGAQFLWF